MNKLVFCVIITSLIFGCSLQKGRLAREVNPFVGTGFHGHTYPGATVPFGAVQLSPDTRKNDWDACAGYHYSDSLISGFSHTHLSGTGCIDFGDILVYPASRTLDPEQGGNWLSPLPFSHRQEWASPGYYKVMLPTEGIQAELTATPYTGVHRYRFDRTGEASVVIDLAHSLTSETIQAAYLEQTAPDEISGMRNTSAWVNNQPIYFAARFSRPIETLTWVKEGKVCRGTVRIDGEKLQAVATFHVKAGETIELQVGVSAVSVENARQNREHDLIGQDFEAVCKKADKAWQSQLSGIRIKGGSPEERVNFYTALYHSSVVPNRINDVNGEYRRHDMGIGRTGKGKNRYSTLSLWDTFRAWHPMMTLLDTALVADIVRSALDIYEITGELPVWPLASGETGTMIGYHSVSVIADAWMKGIRGFDGGKALEAMVRSYGRLKKIPKELIITSGRAIFLQISVRNRFLVCWNLLMTIGVFPGWQRHWVNRTSPDVLPGVPVIISMSSTVPAVSSGENARTETGKHPSILMRLDGRIPRPVPGNTVFLFLMM